MGVFFNESSKPYLEQDHFDRSIKAKLFSIKSSKERKTNEIEIHKFFL